MHNTSATPGIHRGWDMQKKLQTSHQELGLNFEETPTGLHGYITIRAYTLQTVPTGHKATFQLHVANLLQQMLTQILLVAGESKNCAFSHCCGAVCTNGMRRDTRTDTCNPPWGHTVQPVLSQWQAQPHQYPVSRITTSLFWVDLYVSINSWASRIFSFFFYSNLAAVYTTALWTPTPSHHNPVYCIQL